MRALTTALILLTTALAFHATPTAAADCYSDAETHEADTVRARSSHAGCSYEYGAYASSWNSTGVSVEEDRTGTVYTVSYVESSSGYQDPSQSSSWDERRLYVHEGDNEWSADQRVIVNVWDHQVATGGACWGRTDAWADVTLRGVAGVWQGQSLWNGDDPWGPQSPLPCGWNDAVLP